MLTFALAALALAAATPAIVAQSGPHVLVAGPTRVQALTYGPEPRQGLELFTRGKERAPLIVYLIKKGSGDEFTTANAREALNFQITLVIAYVVCFILSFVLIGIFLLWIVILANLILCILAAVKASNGETYRYPMTIRLVG